MKHRFLSFYIPIVNGSPSERIDNGFHIREIINQKTGMIFGKFISAPSACSHRKGARSQRFAAGNTERCGRNYVDLGCGKLASMPPSFSCSQDTPRLVAVPMTIRNGPES